MIESATFTAVVGICSALFSPDYPIEDKMHKAQACEVFKNYCAESNGQSEYPSVEYNYEPNASYRPSVRSRKIQRKHP
jgi:hypothetical protein